MDEDRLATARQAADPSTADPGKRVDKAALARLEQLAIQELSAARPLAGAGHGQDDTLLACIHWDLGTPPR